jgi:hypothetical protein
MSREVIHRWRRLPTPPREAPSRRGMRWSEQDERVVQRFYTTHGSQYTAALLGRTAIAVRHRAQILGVPGFETLAWSEKEVTRLRSLYPKYSVEEIARRMRRSFGSVHGKLAMLGLLDDGPEDWTEAEDALLRKRYPGAVKADEYADGSASRVWSVERIADHLRRSVSAVHSRASIWGMSRYAEAPPWSVADERRLRRLKREGLDLGDMARALRRTKADVADRMRRLGILAEKRGWTPEEDAMLRSSIGRIDRDEIARRLGRSRNAVNARLSFLGITPPRSRPWTSRDIADLRRLHRTLPIREIAARLDRSVDAVSDRVALLGLTRTLSSWSKADDDRLRRLRARRYSYDEIARRMKRSRGAVEGRMQRLGLTRDQPIRRRWSREEDDRLVALYRTKTRREIAAMLDRTPNAIMLRAQYLGITSHVDHRYSETDDAFLRASYPTMTAARIADHLGRSRQSVVVRARRLGLRKTPSNGNSRRRDRRDRA